MDRAPEKTGRTLPAPKTKIGSDDIDITGPDGAEILRQAQAAGMTLEEFGMELLRRYRTPPRR